VTTTNTAGFASFAKDRYSMALDHNAGGVAHSSSGMPNINAAREGSSVCTHEGDLARGQFA
jgi:hypothetical protein